MVMFYLFSIPYKPLLVLQRFLPLALNNLSNTYYFFFAANISQIIQINK